MILNNLEFSVPNDDSKVVKNGLRNELFLNRKVRIVEN